MVRAAVQDRRGYHHFDHFGCFVVCLSKQQDVPVSRCAHSRLSKSLQTGKHTEKGGKERRKEKQKRRETSKEEERKRS